MLLVVQLIMPWLPSCSSAWSGCAVPTALLPTCQLYVVAEGRAAVGQMQRTGCLRCMLCFCKLFHAMLG